MRDIQKRNCSEVYKQHGCHHQGPLGRRHKYIIQNLTDVNVLGLCWLNCKTTHTHAQTQKKKKQAEGWITASATGAVAQSPGFRMIKGVAMFQRDKHVSDSFLY